MGQLIAIEGIDGAGKRTLTDALTTHWRSRGLSVAAMAFPRYGQSIHADLAAESLKGAHGDVVSSAYAMGLLFALDRRAAGDEVSALVREHDVVMLDRWVASNAAYGAARLRQGAAGEMVQWVGDLEYGRFGLPRPNWQVFLDVAPTVARSRAQRREQQDSARTRDTYERDVDLQNRVSSTYAELAQQDWQGRWVVTEGGDPEALASLLLQRA